MAAASRAISRGPASFPACELAITILTNSIDGWAGFWLDGAMHILRAFQTRGAPKRRVRDWTGRWWTHLGRDRSRADGKSGDRRQSALDQSVHGCDAKSRSPAAIPAGFASATGYASHGEPVRRSRNKAGTVTDIWLAGANVKPEKALAAEMERRYAPRKRPRESAETRLRFTSSAPAPRRGTPGARRRANRTCGRPDRPRA